MSDHAKTLILKILLVVGMCSLLSAGTLFVLDFIVDIPYDIGTTIMCVCGIVFAFSGFAFIGLRIIFSCDLRPKMVVAERFASPFVNYQSIIEYLRMHMNQLRYQECNCSKAEGRADATVFIKPEVSRLDVFTVVHVQELTNIVLRDVNDQVTELLLRYYNLETTTQITDVVSMISVFCVDRESPCFQNLLNSNLEQGIKNRRLNTGISFESAVLYIARQTDGFAVTEYRRMRKCFISIMGLT